MNCDQCNTQHKWSHQRGYTQAAFIGLLRQESSDEVERLLDHFLLGESSSHMCHNSICSDPFHVIMELMGLNLQRNGCIHRYKRDPTNHKCPHSPRCRNELRWSSKNHYVQCRTESHALLVALPKDGWKCTKGCLSDSSKTFKSTYHWTKGCPRGGQMVHARRVLPAAKPTYDRRKKDLVF